MVLRDIRFCYIGIEGWSSARSMLLWGRIGGEDGISECSVIREISPVLTCEWCYSKP